MTDRLLTIKLRLQEALCPSQLDVIDESYKHVGHSGAQGGAGHFVISIASTVFAGKKKAGMSPSDLCCVERYDTA
jgi:BolA protein